MVRVERCRVVTAALALVLGAACTSPNPRACDQDTPCPDPAAPFCDLEGLVGGTPYSCLAVECQPGTFVACQDGRALQCAPAGDDYEQVVCERGCDEAAGGCRLCNPSETACTNGQVATCDAAGAVVAQSACPLGCFESEPRCRQVDPSNGLAMLLDQAAAAPPLVIRDGAVIDTLAGTITVGPSVETPLSMLIPAAGDAPAIRVFLGQDVRISNARFFDVATERPVPAFAVVAAGEIRIDGRLDASGITVRIPPGSILGTTCQGGGGEFETGGNGGTYLGGTGGAGGATAGGAGGTVGGPTATALGGIAGLAYPNPDLVPLRGGCMSGERYGGGAIQLVSSTRIVVDPSAGIDVSGAAGSGNKDGAGGGSSGGGILMEAPELVLGAGSYLVAGGGGGSAGIGGTPAMSGQVSTMAAQGGDCPAAVAETCSPGGDGGAATPPTAGGVLEQSFRTGVVQVAGGGGGAAGNIRINTRDGVYVQASTTIISPPPIAAAHATR